MHYVFVHGGWRDSRCWRKILPLIEQSGNTATAIDLPGHGNNKAAFLGITLDSYVDAVVKEAQKHDQVVLVGHSMGGMVISAASEKIPEKITKLILVCAIIPRDGESLLERANSFSQEGIGSYIMFDEQSKGLALRKCKELRELFLNDCDEEEAIEDEKKWQSQPHLPFSDKICIQESFNKIPKLYVKCTQDKCILSVDQQKMAEESGCDVVELKSGHSPYLSNPKTLVELILKNS